MRAVLIVAAMGAAIAVAGAIGQTEPEGRASAAVQDNSLGEEWRRQAASLIDVGKQAYESGSADGALACLGTGGANVGAGSLIEVLPESYRRALAVPSDAQEVHATEDRSVVGFWVPASPEDASAAFTADMEQRGWKSMPLGDVPGATFVGGAGAQSWVLVQFTSVADGSSAVIVAAGLEGVDG